MRLAGLGSGELAEEAQKVFQKPMDSMNFLATTTRFMLIRFIQLT